MTFIFGQGENDLTDLYYIQSGKDVNIHILEVVFTSSKTLKVVL